MAFEDINRDARLAVHAEFGRPAIYVAPGSTRRLPVVARLHTRTARFGGNNQAGYAEVVEDIIRMTFLQSEVIPVRKAEVTVSGSVFKVEIVEPSTDGLLSVCDVVRKGPAL